MTKVLVEIYDTQVVTFLQECINTACVSAAQDMKAVNPNVFGVINISEVLLICESINRTIEYLGGVRVDVPATIFKHYEESDE